MESEIRLEHEADLVTNSDATKKLLDDYAAADREFKDAKAKRDGVMASHAGMDLDEHQKKMRSSKAAREKLKGQILDLVMTGEIKRAGFTKTDKKQKRGWDA